jgi:hypothetical protein
MYIKRKCQHIREKENEREMCSTQINLRLDLLALDMYF